MLAARRASAASLRRFQAAFLGPLRAAWLWLKQTTVCHERTDERRCDAVQEMRVGPSEPAVRSRLQTTASCDGQEPWW